MASAPTNPGRHAHRHWIRVIPPWMIFLPYLVTNLVFVLKYVPRYGMSSLVGCFLYGALAVTLLWIIHAGMVDRLLRAPAVYYAAVLMVAIVLLLLMLQIDPEGIRNGRYWCARAWLERILQGVFPYSAPYLHSGFPFLFVIALPFYWAGDTGLLQILVFVAFAFVMRLRSPSRAASGIMLLLASPAFLYEVIVRSDLFSNTVILVCFLCILDLAVPRLTEGRRLAFGLSAGLLLSTRAIAFILWLPFLAYAIRSRPKVTIQLLAYSLVAFLLTVLPFWIWDPRAFAATGPFSHELSLSRLPFVVIIGLATIAVLSALFVRSLAQMLIVAGMALFAAAAISLLTCLSSQGWDRAIGGDGFDVSYFCFAIPPVLAGYVLGRASPDGTSGPL